LTGRPYKYNDFVGEVSACKQRDPPALSPLLLLHIDSLCL
jgi:hypothetical protein